MASTASVQIRLICHLDEFFANGWRAGVSEKRGRRVERVAVQVGPCPVECGRCESCGLDSTDHVGPSVEVDFVAPRVEDPSDSQARREGADQRSASGIALPYASRVMVSGSGPPRMPVSSSSTQRTHPVERPLRVGR